MFRHKIARSAESIWWARNPPGTQPEEWTKASPLPDAFGPDLLDSLLSCADWAVYAGEKIPIKHILDVARKLIYLNPDRRAILKNGLWPAA
jgi:hypothetical protein